MIDKDSVKDLVGVFYHPPFKIFYINSDDGENFKKPVGVFVSLGITTSPGVIEDIKNIIDSTPEFRAEIVEIQSKKKSGQFMNTIVKRYSNSGEISQYLSELKGDLLDREEAFKELEKMKSVMVPDSDYEILREYAPKISRLSELIGKLDESEKWAGHLIQRSDEDGGYKIFHKYVNYKCDGDEEYRIGILVEDKNYD